MLISDWSSDVCSSDLASAEPKFETFCAIIGREDMLSDPRFATRAIRFANKDALEVEIERTLAGWALADLYEALIGGDIICAPIYTVDQRSEEHTSELQSLMRISYAVFCLKKKKKKNTKTKNSQ